MIIKFSPSAIMALALTVLLLGGCETSTDTPATVDARSTAASFTYGADGATSTTAAAQVLPVTDPVARDLLNTTTIVGAGRTTEREFPASDLSTGGTITAPTDVALSNGSAFSMILDVHTDTANKVDFIAMSIDGSGSTILVPVDEEGQVPRGAVLFEPGIAASEQRQIKATRAPGTNTVTLQGYVRNRDRPEFPTTAGYQQPKYKIAAHVTPAPITGFAGFPPDGGWENLYSQLGFGVLADWTKPVTVQIQYTQVKTGALQFNLTWDSTADIDLYVTRPDGVVYWYGHRGTTDEGLDVDDVTGFGPENVFFTAAPTRGNYIVRVKHYSGFLPSNYVLSVIRPGFENEVYTGSLRTYKQDDLVITYFYGSAQ